MNIWILTCAVALSAFSTHAQDDISGYRSIDVNMTDGSHTYIAFQPEMTIGYADPNRLLIK